jgi:adenine-specific DNA methylase
MGGATTGLEALRLGSDTRAVELNLVAHVIKLSTLLCPQKLGHSTKILPPGTDKPRQLRFPGQQLLEQPVMALPLPEPDRGRLAEGLRHRGESALERAPDTVGQPAAQDLLLRAYRLSYHGPALGGEPCP